MTARPILRWPNRMLQTPAEPVQEVTDEIREIWTDMIDTMEAMPGLGLAAPQIGIGMALAVVDASDERGRSIRFANPKIIETSRETRKHPEGSPCLPGVQAQITRPAEVTVAFLDETGTPREQSFVDLWAISIQHQIDHLAGRMYFDTLSRTKRDMLLKRARKAAL